MGGTPHSPSCGQEITRRGNRREPVRRVVSTPSTMQRAESRGHGYQVTPKQGTCPAGTSREESATRAGWIADPVEVLRDLDIRSREVPAAAGCGWRSAG